MSELVNVCDGCGEGHPVGGDRSKWKTIDVPVDPELGDEDDSAFDDAEVFTKQFCPTCVAKVEAAVPHFFECLD